MNNYWENAKKAIWGNSEVLNYLRKRGYAEDMLNAVFLNINELQAAGISTFTPSKGQTKQLKDPSEVFLIMDIDDEKGNAEIVRAIKQLHGVKTYVINLDGYKSPDEYISAKGISAFIDRVECAEPANVWYLAYITRNYNSLPDIKQHKILIEAMQYIQKLNSPIEKHKSIEVLADSTSLSPEILKAEFTRLQEEKQTEIAQKKTLNYLQQAQEAVNNKDFSKLNTIVNNINSLSRQKQKAIPVPVNYDVLIQKYLNRPTGISFPWRELNRLGQMVPGTITTLIGGTSHGKTSVAIALALHCLGENKRVVYWSGEVPADFIVQKMTGYLAKKDNRTLTREQANFFQGDSVLQEVLFARDKMQKYSENLYIPEAKDFIEVDELITYCRQVEADVLIIDYIQQLRPSGIDQKYRTRDEEIECVLQALNFWVGEKQKIIIALGQMNREAKNVAQPEICYARHSATIEHYSSIVLGIWNASMANKNPVELAGLPINGWYWRKNKEEQNQAIRYALDEGKTMLEISILKNRYSGNVNKAVPLLFMGGVGLVEDFPEHAVTRLEKVVKLQ